MWIKICGFTQPENAVRACQQGVSAIGLNFFAGSKRFVSTSTAQAIVQSVQSFAYPITPDLVGVFVDASPHLVAECVEQVGLTAVQFHGDESTSLISDFHRLKPDTAIIRAVRVSRERIDATLMSLDELIEAVPLRACLLDAFVASEHGGTGVTVDQRLIERYLERDRPRLIVAGGLTQDNVAQIIAATHPWGVDTASGVESSPGMKDPIRMAAFLQQCQTTANVSGSQPLCRL
jgi:phosphoribosylanthranilate isomerase